MNSRMRWTLAIAAQVVFLVGCGGSSSKPEGTVSGTVKVAGQPLANAVVNFQDPVSGSAGLATTDATGKYQIGGPLVAGSFKVYFSPVMATPPADGSSPAIPTLNIADKYKALATTDLVKEVKAGSNTIPLELN